VPPPDRAARFDAARAAAVVRLLLVRRAGGGPRAPRARRMTRRVDETHDPSLRSWVESANVPGTDFPIQNLPLGVFRPAATNEPFRIGVAIGDHVFDLQRGRDLDRLPRALRDALAEPSLNRLMTLGPSASESLRRVLVANLIADARPQPAAL